MSSQQRGSGAQPGPSFSATATSPISQRNFRYEPARSGYTSPGQYSTYSTSTADRVGCLTAVRMSAFAKLSRFTRRLVHIRQMDFEFALWQMLYLLIQPSKVYKNFIYRKRTKDQFARDDPAFLVLLSLSLLFSSIFYAYALGLSKTGFFTFFLWSVFVDCIAVGVIIATILWWVSNRFLRKVRDQDVEWGYCFDVHLNAFFPMLILLHVIVPILYPTLIDSPSFLSTMLGNTFWFLAACYYVYITFLGYTALPILHKTQYFLYPISFIFMFFVATLTAGWNISKTALYFYHSRAEPHKFVSQHNGL
ncbi:CBN-UNC-50 protein [Caenorhabditis brenneri]|uniref:CBN-UNC-50 protein n=1 Tax=Caenorhabditis brenneri TaxID=135651 RepID=G0MLG3_CAEBE|nr:CBN-UNC-50 protein [Caenorhabditis brenneri]